MTHNTNDEKHNDAFSWETLDKIVKSWNRGIGFSWHKQSEMKDPSKFRIFPAFVNKIRTGNRQDPSTCPDSLLPCPMPDCEIKIGGKDRSTQIKNFKKHFLLHFYTVTNQPCQNCELMDQKACFQVDIQKIFFVYATDIYFENLIKRGDNHKCNTPKELRDIRSDETKPALWRPLSSFYHQLRSKMNN